MENIVIRVIDLPMCVKGVTIPHSDGSFNIFINARYSTEEQRKTLKHQLRHAYAKLLYRAGVDAKTAQGLLGHSNINITMDIYTDFSEEMNVKSATKINALMSDLFAI